jgi:hypothetical protein
LPKEYEEYQNSVARVVITLETPEDKAKKKEKLFAVLKEMRKVDMFRDIENPVEWQRNLRNEWD